MKQISAENMLAVNGGQGTYVDGFCAGAAIATLIAPNPVSGAVTTACLIKELYDLFW